MLIYFAFLDFFLPSAFVAAPAASCASFSLAASASSSALLAASALMDFMRSISSSRSLLWEAAVWSSKVLICRLLSASSSFRAPRRSAFWALTASSSSFACSIWLARTSFSSACLARASSSCASVALELARNASRSADFSSSRFSASSTACTHAVSCACAAPTLTRDSACASSSARVSSSSTRSASSRAATARPILNSHSRIFCSFRFNTLI
mmetsp:Transcript_54229/g.126693  ORF Transcript_54229/g.126693 Transcript_54229/m.126693 type:complete len:212 (+) Transcript_54229:187-822(+)